MEALKGHKKGWYGIRQLKKADIITLGSNRIVLYKSVAKVRVVRTAFLPSPSKGLPSFLLAVSTAAKSSLVNRSSTAATTASVLAAA